MKTEAYCVTFSSGKKVVVWALCEDAAKILAQADQIEAGNEWRNVVSVELVK